MGCQCNSFEKSIEIRTDESATIGDVIKAQIEEHPMLVYSRIYCDESSQAKQLLRTHDIPFEYFELENMNDDGVILAILCSLTGKLGSPYVFVNGRYYGGYAELVKGIASGDFFEVLKTSEGF